MKKITLILFAIFAFSMTANAQESNDHNGFSNGDMFVSGTIGYSSESAPDNSKIHEFRVSPRIGYFLTDFFAVGGELGYAYSNAKQPDGSTSAENSTYTIGVFGRYYLLPGSKFSIFGELGLGFGATKNIRNDWTNGVNAAFSPGISYFLGEHFALEASFGVLSYNSVSPEGSNGSTDSFNIGIDLENINFGIIYKF